MASGKASKRKRAEERAKAQYRPTNQPRRLPIWVQLTAGLAVLLIVAIVVLISSLGDGNKSATTSGTSLPEAAAVQVAFRGIPQTSTVLGQPDAPVTLVEYVDLQCPYCQQFETKVFPSLVDKYVRTGKLKVELRGLTFIGPDSERGLEGALAAAKQGRLFQFAALLYANQGVENSGWLTEDMVKAAARSIPDLDVSKLVADMGSTKDQIEQFAAQAQRDNVQSTPTLLVGPSGGKLTKVEVSSPTDAQAVEQAIAAALRQG